MNVAIVKRQQDLISRFSKTYGFPRRAVELGCGDGANLAALARLGMHGEGWDLSEKAVEAARQRDLPGFTVRCQDLCRLDLADEELVLMLLTLEHLENDEEVIGKVASVLRPGGYFILSVPAHGKMLSHQDFAAGHYRRYDRMELSGLLKRHGFTILEFRCLGFPWNSFPTWLYNRYLSLRRPQRSRSDSGSLGSGIAAFRGHMPPEIRVLAGLAFRILSVLRFSDIPFQLTDMGTHYFVLSRREKGP
jgi:SAM-dependent methyltransferase